MMGIGHIFKINDRDTWPTSTRWSITSDNYLLNVFTSYNYSNSFISILIMNKSKELKNIIAVVTCDFKISWPEHYKS